MFNFLKSHKFSLLLIFSSLAFYWTFAYDLQRWDFVKLITLYAALFFIAYKLIQFHKNHFWLLAGIALLFRLVFIVAIPNLSQDFYRFIWDGRLVLEGLNPYLSVPNAFIRDSSFLGMTSGFKTTLIEGMGSLSAGNFTNYPPISQICYAFAAWIGGKSILGSIIVMRIIIIAADFGTLWFGRKLLQKLKLPEHRIFWYVLNPFIIIELTGNLHFEGLMLFFLVWGLYLFFQKKWIWAAVLIGISVSVKLLPLLLLPLFFYYFKYDKNHRFDMSSKLPPLGEMPAGQRGILGGNARRTIDSSIFQLLSFYVIVFVTVFLTFLPFLSPGFIENFGTSLALWFTKFEFNASIYYLIRWIGHETVGWNIIGIAGKILPAVVFLFVLGLAFFRKNSNPRQLMTAMLFAVSVYFFFSTTVHPWYVATPLLLSIFTKYRFALIWSFVVFLSYSAYEKTGVDENLWLVAVEYVVVFGLFFYELIKKGRRKDREEA